MPKSTLESPAWNALSDGSQRLYIALKAQSDNKHHTAYLSTRDAAKALGRRSCKSGRSFRKIREWYAELEHYGFIAMLSAGCLGTDGRGKAPTWRLADKGTTRGGYEPPTQEFLRWDGVLFDRKPYREKTESRSPRGAQGAPYGGRSPVADGGTPNGKTAPHGGRICEDIGVTDGGRITSLNHYVAPADAPPPQPLTTPSKPSLVDFDPNDPRMVALKATERRRQNDKRH